MNTRYSKLLLAFFLLVLFEHLPNICSIGDAKSPKSLPDLLDEVRSSIVAIKAGKYMGSGFVVARNMICTNAHVIEEASEVSVKFNDGTQKSALGTLYLDEETDIAILKVSQVPASIKSLSILNALPRQGERVVAIGYPIGATNTATDGIVSALRSGNQVEKIFDSDGYSGVWIQTNAAINKGNSGGPLLNFFGEVVGMNTFGVSSVEGVENLNFAISSSNIRPAIHIARSSPLVTFDAVIVTTRYKNGSKKSQGKRQNDKPDGLFTSWYENGQKWKESHWKDGKLVSASVWKPDGEPCPITKVVDGSGILVDYFGNGQKYSETHFKDGKREGLKTDWHYNGQKSLVAHWKNGKPDGLWTGGDGKKSFEFHFKDGKVVSQKRFK